MQRSVEFQECCSVGRDGLDVFRSEEAAIEGFVALLFIVRWFCFPRRSVDYFSMIITLLCLHFSFRKIITILLFARESLYYFYVKHFTIFQRESLGLPNGQINKPPRRSGCPS